ncbi:exodeoxyribonuclease V subunit gamma [Propionibacterium sp. NM47_B9-13]|jgi:exodeoxyribonuclease V gamma subunit|uniref:RecBCD enzyme subunit RecC n=2 Tax=Cutibacterium modestum TaxID=2559073 RepID=A0AAD1NVS8_9ACTN|nr:exodeoxyribonuclease V subunit gamma [Cutibacterium modestum]TGY29150.1 exodeoxyribonuclease V subunit gamma [Propionibacterium sp. NM47_B9-13]EFS75324.1 putative exodeoxyribonuclease V, gamma subunit [Cutibacterium modestum HL037PA2]EFT16646.1 putative exodeoxyribonuclease V, gamma subunit [Cutibacterium modestum HL037PA3]MCP2376068.1 putative exodeoxyribonuclease V, gamma subunit [Cutibacterium modestum 28N]MCP2381368.1 putative exodeoxyribonuclease V, gamma subunit [Cutibacterium modestu
MTGVVKVVHSWSDVRDAVVAALSEPTSDPFVRPILVAPGNAQSRALLQSLARRHGIAAGIDTTTPQGLRARLEEDLLGIERETDPWQLGPLALRISRLIETNPLGFEIVSAHLEASRRRGVPRAAWTTARQAADAIYALARDSHEVLSAWADVQDPISHRDDADLAGNRLDPARAWWAPLWRALLAEPCHVPDPVTRHQLLVKAILTHEQFEPPIVWFSSTATAQHDVNMAEALSSSHNVSIIHLDHGIGGADPWRTFDRVRSATTARWTSSSIRTAQSAANARHTELPTVEMHHCHGADRQAEVVRDAVCAALADYPTLEPRDIVVVCCGRQDTAHLLSAGTLANTDHPAHQLRFTTPAPREHANPVTEAVTTILGLASSRATGQDLLSLCAMPAVQARFGFSDDDQETIERLVSQADIRWGVDPAAREKVGLGRIRQSTWLAGTERMVLAIAMSSAPPTHLGTVTPITDVGSTTIPVVGKLAELVSRIRKAFLDTEAPASITTWSHRVSEIADNLTAAPVDAPQSTLETLALLTGLQGVAEDREFDRQEIIDLLNWLTDVHHGRYSWFDGSIQVCRPGELSPVDHEVVIIVDPDHDVVHADPLQGLRDESLDPAAQTRQNLLDVALSARTLLVVVRQARNPVSNLPVLPGPFTTTLSQALAARSIAPRHVNHGLQPFSIDEFSDRSGTSWSGFDDAAAAAARCHPGSQPRPHRIVLPPVTELPESRMSPADLTLALSHPARTLLRARVGAPANERSTELAVALPLAPNSLDKYWIRSRILADLEHGSLPDDAIDAERLRGSTPPGRLGQRLVTLLAEDAMRISQTANRLRNNQDEQFIEIGLDLVEGNSPQLLWPDELIVDPMHPVHLRGRVGVRGHQIVHAVATRANARPLLNLWIDLLAVTVATDEAEWFGALVSSDGVLQMAAPAPDHARDILAGLARLAWWSNQQLIPLPVKLAHALVGLPPMACNDYRTGNSALQVQWLRERDANWAAFLGTDVGELIARCHELGTTLEELSGWLFNPIIQASRGVGPSQPTMAQFSNPGGIA